MSENMDTFILPHEMADADESLAAVMNEVGLNHDFINMIGNGTFDADGHDLKRPMRIKRSVETGLQQRVWSTVAFGDATDLKELLGSRHLEEAKRLLEAIPENGLAAIHQAARRGNLAMLTLILEQGVNASAADRCAGRTALHLAVQGCHEEVAIHLVREVSDIIDSNDWKGQTALHYATIAAQHRPSALKLCELLLDAEADPEACDLEGVSPLELAFGNSKLEELLEKYVYDLERKFAQLRLKVEICDDDI
jgi:Ankyrin repeats (many copies)/Ankyrin repeat